ncbi:MAG: hypothetical protein IKI97_12565 [Clostridia bacterium]|nr:hypothetical protein [Clostridia bacterium]MBR3996099.1 hypothetical protein [Clostridia bacterium]
MFVFDWFMDWIYGKVMEFVQDFFSYLSGMGVEIFSLSWIQAVIEFFRLFGWAMYVIALVVAIFDVAIAYQNGQGNMKDAGLGAIKGFMAVNLFTVVPIELYKLAVDIQNGLGNAMTGLFGDSMSFSWTDIASDSLSVVTGETGLVNLFCVIALGYAVIKVFFANIKRGGILVTNIAVGSLYIFGLTRGHQDGFVDWCKQVVAVCVTAFLQNTLLFAGLLTFRDHMMLGLGIMLAANEVPRIADRFGLDTSARVNIMSTYYATQAAVRTTQAIMKAVKK